MRPSGALAIRRKRIGGSAGASPSRMSHRRQLCMTACNHAVSGVPGPIDLSSIFRLKGGNTPAQGNALGLQRE